MSKEIFVISDHHLNHENILKFKRKDGDFVRNFYDVFEMNEIIVKNHNAVVRPQDKVYFLGDVYFGSQKVADELLKRMNGHKRLICGNHDNLKDTVLHKNFEKIYMWRIFKEFGCMLTHVPLREDQMKTEKNLHGHIHYQTSPSERHVNMCVEWHNYTPVHITEAVKLKTHG